MFASVVSLSILVLIAGADANKNLISQWMKECGLDDLGPNPTLEEKRAVDPCQYECFMNKRGLMQGGKVIFEKIMEDVEKHCHNAEQRAGYVAMVEAWKKKFDETSYTGDSECSEAARLLASKMSPYEDPDAK